MDCAFMENLVKENKGLKDSIRYYKDELKKYKRAVQELKYIYMAIPVTKRQLDSMKDNNTLTDKEYRLAIIRLENKQKDIENILSYLD